jgi:hypothetical protein
LEKCSEGKELSPVDVSILPDLSPLLPNMNTSHFGPGKHAGMAAESLLVIYISAAFYLAKWARKQ